MASVAGWLTVHDDTAGRLRGYATKHIEGAGFAGAVGTDDAEDFASHHR